MPVGGNDVPGDLEPTLRGSDHSRCQFWLVETVEGFWQCGQPSRPGYKVCGWHGAGFEKRVRAGLKQDPKIAGAMAAVARHGIVAGVGERKKNRRMSMSKEMRAEVFAANPPLAALYGELRVSPDLINLRDELAMARALARHYSSQADMDEMMPDPETGAPPPVLQLIESLETVLKIGERVMRLERELGPITPSDMKAVVEVFSACLREFVPGERLDEARAYCARGLAEYNLRSSLRKHTGA